MEENKKTMVKISEIMKDYDVDYASDFLGYSGYVSDVISELAGGYIDIYYSDLTDWARGNYTYIDEAAAEFGQAEDFMKSIQQGQYLYYEQDINSNLTEILVYYGLDYLKNIKEDLAPQELIDKVIEEIEYQTKYNCIGSLDEIPDFVDNMIAEYEEEAEQAEETEK